MKISLGKGSTQLKTKFQNICENFDVTRAKMVLDDYGVNKHKHQEVDVHKRLEATLELVKKQVEINETEVNNSLSEKIRERIESTKEKIPKHVLKVIEEELTDLKMLEAYSCDLDKTYECYEYLDWLTVLPWENFSDDNFDVLRAEKILNEDHYGLSDVKERILEFLAVAGLRGTPQGKIICLSRPPGVGKTSIVRSIARALGRKFFRLSVGGLHDVDVIKGVHRSYNLCLPGKLVQCLKSVGTFNPVILIDEIDKLGRRGQDGDPASALLEVLDPEQNANFLDHYLDVTIDLSKVLFVCTANEIDKIPGPLLDRMEVISIAGYITDEKMHIARDHLLITTCRACGIKPQQVDVTDAALFALIENYCREAGVRNLQKHIEKLYRKIALSLVRQGASAGAPAAWFEKVTIDESNLADYVGKPVFRAEKIYEQTPVGVVMGLAWTSMGGSTLYIETASVEEGQGKGDLYVTGQLGDVMKESAEIAHTVARRIMLEKEPENHFFADSELHLHVPEGATPKDGPSTGCTMITSLLSLAMKQPVKKDLAMTGEVSLTGRILPIGGVKEKTIGARRSQVKTIIFPEDNRKDFDELPENLKEGLDVHFVDEYDQIFEIAFGYPLGSPMSNIKCNLTSLTWGFKKGFVTSLGLLHSSPSYDFLPLRQSVTLNSRISYSRSFYGAQLATPEIRVGSTRFKSPLFQLTGWNRSSHEFGRSDGTDFFCNAVGSDSDPKSSPAIVSETTNLEDCLTVIALPLPNKPLIPGFYMPITVKDPKLLAALQEIRSPYAGAFLLKDDVSTDSFSSTFETENILDKLRCKGTTSKKKGKKLKGKDLLHRIHQVGTLAQISSIQGEQVILIGRRRLRITEMVSKDPLTVTVEHLKDKPYDKEGDVIKATFFEVISTLKDVLQTTSLWRDQHIGEFNYQHLADFGAGISGANKQQNQGVLEELDVHKRLELTLELVKKQVEINKKTDDESLLSEKIRGRYSFMKEKIPKHVLKVVEEELTKLETLSSWSSDFDVTHNHLDWLTLLPWGKLSYDNFDAQRAKEILDKDHYGLSDVKERILEFIAVARLRGTSQGKIICLSGPPGVGKTSIGRSIARALGRKFFRLSVGGLSDVAEIKGHCQTYVGAMPGKMVQCLKTVGTENPLILIDEIDKLGRCREGDPASALLEVMDPEQNANFLDHFLNVTIDLSKVLFVCTANEIDAIPGPLLDRMEVISIAGYTSDEKLHIARDHLLKTTCRDCGIKSQQVDLSDAALLSLIENYCREAGVRNLQKHIEKIYRKIALKLVRQGASSDITDTEDTKSLAKTNSEVERMKLADIMKILESATGGSTESKAKQSGEVVAKMVEKVMIDESNLADYVGKPVFRTEKIYEQTPVGVVMGLAWTSMGGSTLYIETASVEEGQGKGGLHITGQLGDVMKESAEIAHTVARRIMLEKEPENRFFADSKLHLHVPAGATPKDGPSAGCTMITSLLSLAMKKPVKKDLAMTGEVTLTGRILPIGGVKEKSLAARRSQVKTIIFPEANRKDFDELPENLKQGLSVHFVDEYEQIFEIAFGYHMGSPVLNTKK
ncbi:unnamed protein product [Thlaspi arvense]|uniref:Lon protease homolog, mitochondrial n=1 Tax=Thlaspi arvense TaxID=13288 RepID=A0AAU9S2G5_THLAR|nr:unnamed protein product [Thlaspi arvense]